MSSVFCNCVSLQYNIPLCFKFLSACMSCILVYIYVSSTHIYFCSTLIFSGFKLHIQRPSSNVTLLNAIWYIHSHQRLGGACVFIISTMTFWNVALSDTCIFFAAAPCSGNCILVIRGVFTRNLQFIVNKGVQNWSFWH